MLNAILPHLPLEKLAKLDFEFTSEQIMETAVKKILQRENPRDLYRQNSFCKMFTNVYAGVEKLPESENRTEMLKLLNNRVYAPANGMQKKMSDYMIKKTDEEIRNRAIMWTKKSKELREECLKYQIKFIDVSYDRKNTFEKLIEELNIDE